MMERYQGQNVQWTVGFSVGGKEGQTVQPCNQSSCILSVELGEEQKVTAEKVRVAAARAAKTLRDLKAETVVVDAGTVVRVLGPEGTGALSQGVELALFRTQSWKQTEPTDPTFYLDAPESCDEALKEADSLTKAICFARDLVNCPANKLTPIDMAQRMTKEAQALGIETQVLDEDAAKALGMEAFLTVGSSAAHPARLIVLRYKGGQEGEAPIALVGKGVACDTGGYCLKSAKSMKGIRGDMAGAAAVCGALLALAANRVKVNATAVIPAVENRIAPDSYIPGDVIGSMSGKTIEIGNTDAEGRLILADAVTYAIQKEHAAKVVDIATLTGAVVGMFGFTTAGFLCNSEEFCADFQSAYTRSGEQYWRLPTFPEYQKMIESPVADVSNVSSDGCGTITAGLFIGSFVEERPWIHLDIAGTAWVDSPRWAYQTPGATGAGVSTLYELCKGYARED
ncbi:MAG TPA: leucyl aminopeptidase [Candidatus Flavonifractor merdigallinarum]|uniref:Probable cytosol aminopeptidase n=1 Tax=Candidatus Flavonifractor merdigallinarum TaxID=2838589 RepID=A0A9D2BXS8_9FIRM|nr:leucyl aminopeptidase [Candidatus Flavonifractor merdigallinarum]